MFRRDVIVVLFFCLALTVCAAPRSSDSYSNQHFSYQPFSAGPPAPSPPQFSLNLDGLLSGFRQWPFSMFGDRRLAAGFGPLVGGDGASPPTSAVTVTDCDSATFSVSVEDYEIIRGCQEHAGSDLEGVKKCIIDAPSPNARDIREFLDRDNLRLKGVSFSVTMSSEGRVSTTKHKVVLRMCPDDEINLIESSSSQTSNPTDSGRPSTHLHAGSSVNSFNFGFPNVRQIFSSILSSLNSSLAMPQYPQSGSFLPNFTSSINVDWDNCASERFNVSLDVMRQTMRCKQEGGFVQCINDRLPQNADTQKLLDFVNKPNHTITGSSSYSYISVVNGERSEKHVVRLERCADSAQKDTSVSDDGARNGSPPVGVSVTSAPQQNPDSSQGSTPAPYQEP